MNKSEAIKQLDLWVSQNGMGSYGYEPATRENPYPPTAVYGVGGSFDHPIQQSRQEIYALIDVLLQVSPRNCILETGAGEWGGTHRLWQILFDKIITIEIEKQIIDKIAYPTDPHKDYFIIGDSRASLNTVLDITRQIDVLFLDSHHYKEVVVPEYNLYSPLVRPGGLIVFHDAISPLFPMSDIMEDLKEGRLDGKKHEMVLIDDCLRFTKIGIAYMTSDGSSLPVPDTNNWRLYKPS